MKTTILALGGLFFCLLCQAQVSEKDRKFAMDAAQGGLYEVQLGQLAQTKGLSPQVKDLGKMMADDHSRANDELSAMAMRKGISLPTTLDEKHQKAYDKLAQEQGSSFDKKYSHCMVKDHKKDLCHFKKQAKKGTDTELKSYASAKVPVLEHHLHMAKQTCKSTKH